ncbi:MAG: LamG domain-containing protein [Candidatus Bathyarchaeia archaeon]|jgi:hypothetical protein
MFVKACICLLISLLLISPFDALGVLPYTSAVSDSWGFGNNCYLSFGEDTSFEGIPKIGGLYDNSLVAYWAMNEDSETTVVDLAGNGNDGLIIGTNISEGKYGNARYFDGASAILVNDSQNLRLNSTDFSLSAIIKLDDSGNGTFRTIIRKGNTGYNPFYCLRITPLNKIEFTIRDNPEPANSYSLFSKNVLPAGEWTTITVTFNSTSKLVSLYIDGLLNAETSADNVNDFSSNKVFVIGRASENLDQYFKGDIDEVRVYNRTLTDTDVLALNSQPDPASFVNYFSFVDSVTNNVMIVYLESSLSNDSTPTLVKCTNFFNDNKLNFEANGNVTLNIWTNLGKPIFTTGLWNDFNFTTTLVFDAFSVAELNWNLGTPPSYSNIQTTTTSAGNTTLFSVVWSDNQGLFGGGYILSTNNTGQWINSTWIPFNSNLANATLVLNSAIGATVSFIVFANNSRNLWTETKIYSIKTTVAYPQKPDQTSNPTPTPTLTPYSVEAPTPTPTQNSSRQTSTFPNEVFIIPAIILILIAFAFVFKKGFISVDVVEDDSKESTDDYSI